MTVRGRSMAETLASQHRQRSHRSSTGLFGGAGTGGVVRLVVAMGTLLGPEETNTRVSSGVPPCCGLGRRRRWWVVLPGHLRMVLPGMTWTAYRSESWPWGWGWLVWCCWVVVGWSLVENCTVDASIFVVKLSRANGGCLGTRSR